MIHVGNSSVRYFFSKVQSDSRIEEATIVPVCDPGEEKETGTVHAVYNRST